MFINRNPSYFLTIARERNITRAAEKLFITQSSLSQHLSKLEQELGGPLFDRSQTPLVLTNAGRIYQRYLESTSFMYQQLLEDLNSDRLQSVDVGIGTWRGSILMPQLLPEFLAQNPTAQINLHEFPVSELITRLEDGKVDFAVMNTSPMGIPKGIVSETVMEERIFLMLRREHPLAREFTRSIERGQPIDLHLLEHERYLALDPNLTVGRHIDNFLEKNKLAFPNKLNTTNNRTALRLAAAGMGFCFMIETGLQDDLGENLTSFDLQVPELALPLSLLYKTNAYLSPLAQQLMEEIRLYYAGTARRDQAIPAGQQPLGQRSKY